MSSSPHSACCSIFLLLLVTVKVQYSLELITSQVGKLSRHNYLEEKKTQQTMAQHMRLQQLK